MKFFNQLIPWLSSILIFILAEQLLKTPNQVYFLAPLSLAVVILSIWQLTGRNFFSKKFWQNILTPTFFLVGSLLFLSFLEGNVLKQFFVIGLSVFLWIVLKVVFLRWHLPVKYQTHSLENISTHLDLITLFFMASSLFSLMVFLAISSWLIIMIFAIIMILLSSQLSWLAETNLAETFPFLAVISLGVTEIFWTVSFLPTSVYVNGLIVTLSYYIMSGISRNWLLGIKEGRVVKRYLSISGITLAIVLFTAKWF